MWTVFHRECIDIIMGKKNCHNNGLVAIVTLKNINIKKAVSTLTHSLLVSSAQSISGAIHGNVGLC